MKNKPSLVCAILLAVGASCAFAQQIDFTMVASAAASAVSETELVEVRSTADGIMQPCWFWAPEKSKTKPVPLVVGLHTWSLDVHRDKHFQSLQREARRLGWALVGPNFRGPNSTPQACGSDLAVQDIVDAVEYAKSAVKIDSSRIYIIGGSGGGHMTLLMVGRHPEMFAGAAAFCPIADLSRWHGESLEKHPGRGARYARMMEAACGGSPADKKDEYAHRSPLTWLRRAKEVGVPVYVATGIHDGWTGSVPVGHAIRAFNALCNPVDAVSEEDIRFIEAEQAIPESLKSESVVDPFYPAKMVVHFRRTSGNVRLTLFEGGHAMNFPAGLDFLSRQRKGRPVDWTLPAKGKGNTEELSK